MSLASIRLALAAALAVLPFGGRGAPALDGEYDSPLGRIRVSGDGTTFRGILASPSALCAFRPGEEVLQGTLLDDSLAGRLRVCLTGKGCAAEEWASALLLASPDRLSGAVHVAAKGCVGPFGRKGGVTLGRAGRSAPPETGAARRPAPPGPDDAKGRRARARGLLREGKTYLEEGSFERARARFLAAIEADPEVPEAYNGVGVTFRMRNALDDALAWYKKALSADPDFGDAYYNMACIYSLQGREKMALRYLKIAALNGYVSGEGLDADPDLQPLRQHPDYRALRARM